MLRGGRKAGNSSRRCQPLRHRGPDGWRSRWRGSPRDCNARSADARICQCQPPSGFDTAVAAPCQLRLARPGNRWSGRRFGQWSECYRGADGVVGTMSVADNIAIEEVRGAAFSRMGLLSRRAMRLRATKAIADYDVRCPGPDAEARLLSGSNVQKPDPGVGAGARTNRPTRGLDVGAPEKPG